MDKGRFRPARALAFGCLAMIGCGPDEATAPDPAGVEIAFVRSYDDGTRQLRGFSPGTADVALLPAEPFGTSVGGLRWSADGRLLAFWRSTDPPDGPREIDLLDPELGEARALTEGLGHAWSPVGPELGFMREQAEGSELIVIDASAVAIVQRQEHGPNWSRLSVFDGPSSSSVVSEGPDHPWSDGSPAWRELPGS